jgi:hypothetical protein
MCTVLVGRGFALRKWLATLLLASRPVWRGQTYMYPVVRSSTASWDGAVVAPIDSVILVTTLWKSYVSATRVS